MYPKKQLAQLVITTCQYYNIKKVVISPGSRNAPLIIGFSNVKDIETFSIVDERCAAFFALGIAQQIHKPVVLVCTSGSALLNYYPAIAEAYYSRIPLLVISADRPGHLINIGDGQTIQQENVFHNHILFSANLIESENQLTYNKEEITKAVQTCFSEHGPVHINVPFSEPVYEMTEELQEFDFNSPNITTNKTTQSIDFDSFSEIWNSSKKKLILLGVNYHSDELQELLNNLLNDKSVLIMTEATSNIHHPKFINSIDKLITKLSDNEFEALQPELLITCGGMVISKRIKQFLRKYQPKHHWHINEFVEMNTYFCLSEFIREKPLAFFRNLQPKVNSTESDYQKKWLDEKKSRNMNHEITLKKSEYSDLKVFESVLKAIPDNSQVQVSNSSVIRYIQLFDVSPSFEVFCNRGTSGIDGSTSTAIGAAYASNRPTTLITGDLSFFYDSNAFWNSYIPKSLRVIIVNNSGGGIFKIIPGPRLTNALRYFEVPHNLTARHIANMYNLSYYKAGSLAELENGLADLYTKNEKPQILEIFTPSNVNDTVLKKYFNSL